jgi:predicted metal-dependent peptidase
MAEVHGQHQHRGVRAVQRMVEYAPSTGGLALWVRHQDLPGDTPTVLTDGTTIFYGQAFDRLALPEQTAMVAHEVLHIALRHPQRALELRRLLGEVDLRLFNICADAIVNSSIGHLSWLRLPATAVTLEDLLAHALGMQQDAMTALLEWDVERLYRTIDDRRIRDREGQQKTDQTGESGDGASHSPSEGARSPRQARNSEGATTRQDGPRSARARELGDRTETDLVPSPDSEAAPEAEAELARAWSERLLRGHANDGAFSMLRQLIADLPRSRTPWQQVLRTRLARGLTRRLDVSWSRPTRSYIANQGRGGANRRLPFEPGFSASKTAPKLAVIVDISGSVDDELMQQFATEVAAISRRQEAGLVLVIGDDQVRRIEVFKPGGFRLGELDVEGGGGTDFTPLLEAADRHRPDIGVVLTDLDGPARFTPDWPVIWAVPQSHAFAVPPFGQRLVLD